MHDDLVRAITIHVIGQDCNSIPPWINWLITYSMALYQIQLIIQHCEFS